MKPITELKFKFRGNRNYIHGPDIYLALSSLVPDEVKANAASVQLSCNSMMNQNAIATVKWSKEGVADSIFTVKSKSPEDAPFHLYVSAVDEAPEGSIPYDEDKATDGWVFSEEESSAELINPNPEYTVLQTIVAINKVFLSKLNGNPNGKWIFARIKAKGFSPEGCRTIRLISKPTRSLRLVRSKIEIDGEPFGEIYFSLI